MRKMLRLFAIIATLVLSACSTEAPERMASLKPFHHRMAMVSEWKTHVGGTDGNYLRLNPVWQNGTLFASAHSGRVVAMKDHDGQIVWERKLRANVTSGVGIGGNRVVVGTSSGLVIALDCRTGRVLWRSSVPGEVLATPAVTRSQVFVKTDGGHLFALSAMNGSKSWSYKIENPSLVLRGDSDVVVSGNKVIAGFADGGLIAFDKRLGSVIWRRQLSLPAGAGAVERMVDVTATPVVEGNRVYAVNYQGRVAALNKASGQMLWQRELSSYSGIALGRSAIYLTDAEGHIWALSKRKGSVLWHNDQLEGRGLSAPAVADNVLVVGDKEGYVHWLDVNDGHFLARNRVDSSPVIAAPLVHQHKPVVYVYSSYGTTLEFLRLRG